MTSRLNIYYNVLTFLAVCCPQLYPRKCIYRLRKKKSAKSAKLGKNGHFGKPRRCGENLQSLTKSVQLELKVLEFITLKNFFVTSRLNIYYNFQTLLAVFCPQWCPRKCTKRARTVKSAKTAKLGKNGHFGKPTSYHIEKFL